MPSEETRSDSLIVGHRIRCPRCGTAQAIGAYFVFSKPEAHAEELNTVYKCRAKVRNATGKLEACRCIFSVGLSTEELIRAERAVAVAA